MSTGNCLNLVAALVSGPPGRVRVDACTISVGSTRRNAETVYVWPLIVTNGQSMFTDQLGLSTFRGAYGITDWGRMMAATCIITAHVIGTFLFGQRQFIEGIAMTGMKV